MVVRQSAGGIFFDQSLVHQPVDGAGSCPGLTELLPDRDQLRMAFIQFVPEAPERSPPGQCAAQAAPGGPVADALGEVDHVPVPDVGRQRVDQDQVQLIEVDRVLTVDSRIAGPEDHIARLRGRSAIDARSRSGPPARWRSPQHRSCPSRAPSQRTTRDVRSGSSNRRVAAARQAAGGRIGQSSDPVS